MNIPVAVDTLGHPRVSQNSKAECGEGVFIALRTGFKDFPIEVLTDFTESSESFYRELVLAAGL